MTNHLSKVELVHFQASNGHFELIRFLLKHGRVLQEMNIAWASDRVSRTKIVDEVMKMPKASPSVELTFSEISEDYGLGVW